jgi:D-glycero-D-manno-heptose 1,7-bisphosphate phosphatase
MPVRHKAIFMDRDGTLVEEAGYMVDSARFKPFSWTGEALRKINASGMKAVLITNQSGVGRGYFPESLVHEVHNILHTELARYGAHLDAVYFCPHLPDAECDCRKPRPGMILRAARELEIDIEGSFMIGDRYLDAATAHAAGAKSVLVRTGDGAAELERHRDSPLQPHFVADNLLLAVEAILSGQVK